MTWLSLPGWVRRERAMTGLHGGRWAGSLARRFLLASLLIFVANGLLLAWWVGRQIQANVVHHAGASAALFVESLVSPALQPLMRTARLDAAQITLLDQLLAHQPLSDQIVAIKIWGRDGTILYSPNRVLIGRHFDPDEELADALTGRVTADISNLHDPENAYERQQWSRLLQVY